jgi:hypothetical protein
LSAREIKNIKGINVNAFSFIKSAKKVAAPNNDHFRIAFFLFVSCLMFTHKISSIMPNKIMYTSGEISSAVVFNKGLK